ncbi:hypothetical protein DPMN_045590 [Dreissena polymorpha]|uniref:Uncharacterized protein n=1 Tax=Dreissena polymorpha TaxID=45954 RepID=A0A9D4D4F2_DREPO|nr:hypothetical protein DPMN_045590 [Dreissena polymorpha]
MKHSLPSMSTFGKPWYWKAAEIIIDMPQSSCLKSIVLMLGCFHTLMEKMHIMTGKAVQTTIRGNFRVDKYLQSQLKSGRARDSDTA